MKKKATTPAFRLGKVHLTGLAAWLNQLPLEGKRSRMRTRFVAKLAQSIALTEKERKQILEKAVVKEKGEDGKEVWKTQTVDNLPPQFVLSPEKIEDFQKEMTELYSEDFVMSVTPETEEMVAVIKDIILNTNHVFGVTGEERTEQEKQDKIRQAQNYVAWCDAVENL